MMTMRSDLDDCTVLVEHFTGAQPLTIICPRCRTEAVIDADDLNSEDVYGCPADCGDTAQMKYWEADHRCAGCGALGFFPDALKNCCSRVCMLQAEYLAVLLSRNDAA